MNKTNRQAKPGYSTDLAQAASFELAGRITEAEAVYRRIVNADPSFHPAWHALGLLTFNSGNVALAVQYLEAAIACGDKIALYHRNVGEMYRRMGKLDKSVKAGLRAVKFAPGDIDAHYNL